MAPPIKSVRFAEELTIFSDSNPPVKGAVKGAVKGKANWVTNHKSETAAIALSLVVLTVAIAALVDTYAGNGQTTQAIIKFIAKSGKDFGSLVSKNPKMAAGIAAGIVGAGLLLAGGIYARNKEKVYDKDCYNAFGFDKDGLDKDGYNEFGFDKEGLNRKGEKCNHSLIDLDRYGLLDQDVDE